MINLKLTLFLESNNLHSNLQISFRAKRNTLDQIVHIEILIKEAFIKKEHLVTVLFDLEKDYYTIWLYDIFKDLGLQDRLSIFIKHFLEDRTFQTQIDNTLSDPKQQELGVPQGSIPFVIRFMIKMNKITTCLPPKNQQIIICLQLLHLLQF